MLSSKYLGIGIAALIAIVAVIAFFSYLGDKDARQDKANVNLGRAEERLEANNEVFNHVQDANDARDAARNEQSVELNRMRDEFDRSRRQNGQ